MFMFGVCVATVLLACVSSIPDEVRPTYDCVISIKHTVYILIFVYRPFLREDGENSDKTSRWSQ